MKSPHLSVELILSTPTLIIGFLTTYSLHTIFLTKYLTITQFTLIYLSFGLLTVSRTGEKILVLLTPGVKLVKGEQKKLLDDISLLITNKAGVRKRRWLFALEESKYLNASTSGLHLIVLTPSALNLPTNELRAVLSHEIAHQIHKDTISLHANWWFTLPTNILLRTKNPTPILLLATLLYILSKNSPSFSSILLLATLTLTLLIVFTLLKLAIDRRNELAADYFAYQLGYGDDLIKILSRFTANPKTPALFLSHPRIDKRIKRLSQYPKLPIH